MERQFYQSDTLQKHFKPFYALLIIALFSMLPGIFIIHRASPAILPIYMLNGFLVILILILFKFGLKSKQNKPFIMIDDDTFTIFPGFISFLTKRSVGWKELKGFYRTRLDFSSWPLKNKDLVMVRLVTQSNKTVVSFSLQYVEQDEELLAVLRERITDLTALEHEEFLHAGDQISEIFYQGWYLTNEGIHQNNEQIPWESITRLRPHGIVVAGYGGLKVHYLLENGTESWKIIPAKSNAQYRSFVSRMVSLAVNATIDQKVLDMMLQTPQEARAQVTALLLQLLGVMLIFFTYPVLKGYALTSFSDIPLWLGMLVWMMTALIGAILKSQRTKGFAIRQMHLILLGNLAFVFGVILYFLLTPASFQIFLGDTWMAVNQPAQARSYYDQALKEYRDHPNVLYKNARASFLMKDYPACLRLMIKAYEQDPKNWAPDAIELLPESLLKLGRRKEARDWCKNILENDPKNQSLQREIGKLLHELKQ